MICKIFHTKDKTKRYLSGIIGLIILLVVVIAAAFFLSQIKFSLIWKKPAPVWQAVFLDNNQVYFGRIIKETQNTVVMRDIYYLQVQQLTPAVQKEEEQISEPQLSLVKLGEELHGPENEMRINRQHVLFIERLKPGSLIVQKIEELIKRK